MKHLARLNCVRACAWIVCLALVHGSVSAQKLKVYVLAGQSNMQGHAQVSTFDYIGDDPATAPLLAEMRAADGRPRVCDDVWISYLTQAQDGDGEGHGKLTAGYGARRDPAQDGGKIGPEHEVVHVAHVAGRAQHGEHVVVEATECEVRKPLAGEIADRQAMTIGTAGAHDDLAQGESLRVGEHRAQRVHHDVVRQRREERLHVELQEPLAAAHESLRVPQRAVLALAAPAGEALVDEAPVQLLLDRIDERVVHDAVAERGGGEGSWLRVLRADGSPHGLREFDDPLPGVEGRDDCFEGAVESILQRRLAAVAQPDPDEAPRVVRSIREEEEVLVLADDDAISLARPGPNRLVRRFVQADLGHVRGLVSPLSQAVRELPRELVVDQEPHATRMTVWLVCWAA